MRKTLSNKEMKELNEKISNYNISFLKTDKIENVDNEYIFVNGTPYFFSDNNQYVPTLKLLLKDNSILKQVVVDMGAVKFVVSGADIMRPGIVGFGEGILKDSFVVVVDVNNKKPLCIGKALFSSEELKSISVGKVIKNLHFVGDEIWNK